MIGRGHPKSSHLCSHILERFRTFTHITKTLHASQPWMLSGLLVQLSIIILKFARIPTPSRATQTCQVDELQVSREYLKATIVCLYYYKFYLYICRTPKPDCSWQVNQVRTSAIMRNSYATN